MKRIPFRLEDTQEYQDLLRQQEVEQSRTPASAIAQALQAKNVGPVAVDPAAKAQREYDYATQPPEVIQQGIAMLPEAVQPVAELLAPSRADLLTAGVTKLGSLAAKATGLAKPAQGMVRELITYHGTPHTFPAVPDNPLGAFDASKIGTGEGAQSYGHGLYFAEEPQVARIYKTALQGGPMGVNVMNAVLKALGVPYDYAASESMFIDSVRRVAGEGEDAVRNAIIQASKRMAASELPGSQRNAARVRAFADNPAIVKAINEEAAGSLYTADLPDEMVDRMLDWDKPLSEQPAGFKQLMKVTDLTGTAGFLAKSPETTTFGELYNALRNQNPQSDVSEYFRKSGIPGIKYLDAGSRGTGKGTRNFVVFPGEESNVKILKRE